MKIGRMRFSSASPLASFPCTSVSGRQRAAQRDRGLVVLVGPVAAQSPNWTRFQPTAIADARAAAARPHSRVVEPRATAAATPPQTTAVDDERAGRRQPDRHLERVGVDLFEERHARQRRRAGRRRCRRATGSRAAASRRVHAAASAGSRLPRASTRLASATSAGIRNTNRRSLPTSWTSSSSDPTATQSSSSRSPSPARRQRDAMPHAPNSPAHNATHIRLNVSCRIGNHDDAHQHRVEVVRRLARDRHLPVVEPVLGPVRAGRTAAATSANETAEPAERPHSARRSALPS